MPLRCSDCRQVAAALSAIPPYAVPLRSVAVQLLAPYVHDEAALVALNASVVGLCHHPGLDTAPAADDAAAAVAPRVVRDVGLPQCVGLGAHVALRSHRPSPRP